MKFHIIVAVWGDQYLDLFLNYCLPNQLTPGNLKAFSRKDEPTYNIYTSPEDEPVIRNHKYIKELGDIMPVNIKTLTSLTFSSAHQGSEENTKVIYSMRRCHSLAMSAAVKDDAAAIFLNPDIVISEGSIARIIQHAHEGKRVVLSTGLRLTKESFLPEFKKSFVNKQGYAPIPARDLVEAALKHLHPLTECFFLGSKTKSICSQLCWRAGEDGILVRCTCLTPLLIWPKRSDVLPYLSIDGDYMYDACPNPDDYHVITDSDEICVFEISPENKMSNTITAGRYNAHAFAQYLNRAAIPRRRKTLFHKIRIHSNDLGKEWEKVESGSDKVIRRAIELSATFDFKKRSMSRPVRIDGVKQVIIYGTGSGGEMAMEMAAALQWKVLFFIDSDPNKKGEFFHGRDIKSPPEIVDTAYDVIVVASTQAKGAMFETLKDLGVSRNRILYFLTPIRSGNLETRLIFD